MNGLDGSVPLSISGGGGSDPVGLKKPSVEARGSAAGTEAPALVGDAIGRESDAWFVEGSWPVPERGWNKRRPVIRAKPMERSGTLVVSRKPVDV